MAAGEELRIALEASVLRLTAVEEQLVFNTLSDMDKRVKEFLTNANGNVKAREPYEFS